MRGRAKGPGRLWKRDRMWVLDFVDEAGDRRRRALSSNRREAEQIRADLVRRRDLAVAGLSTEVGQDLAVGEVLSAYLTDLEPRVTPRHFKNVRLRLEKASAGLDGLLVADLRPMHLIRLRTQASTRGRSNRTANLIVTTVQAAFRWAVENEFVAKSPVEHVKRLPESEEHRRYRRRALSEAEIERFLQGLWHDDDQTELLWDYQRVPQLPLFRAMLETAARWGELRTLRWADVDLRRGTVCLRAENTKSRRQRVIPLTDEFTSDLRALKALHEAVLGRLPAASDLVFLSPEGCPWPWHTTNLMRILDRVLQRAGIAKSDAEGRKLDIHALRHTAATRLARAGVPLAKTQALLGHSDPKLTARVYTHLDAEDLRDAVRAAGPVGRSGEQARIERRAATGDRA